MSFEAEITWKIPEINSETKNVASILPAIARPLRAILPAFAPMVIALVASAIASSDNTTEFPDFTKFCSLSKSSFAALELVCMVLYHAV